jgi:acyl-CoA synthetase (NDP forming)
MFSLNALFAPRSVAVLGASDNPGRLGFHVMKSLVTGGYPGDLFPINPGRSQVLGYPTFSALVNYPTPERAARALACLWQARVLRS